MAKFAVGEKCQANVPREGWQLCEVIGAQGESLEYPEYYRIVLIEGSEFARGITIAMHGVLAEENELRKLPGDSLPSWLTNMLTLPASDPDKVKQPEKVNERS